VLAALRQRAADLPGPRALVTFAFGLIHGFGFAGVLAELDLPVARFAWALLQFNVGLELGQVAVVAAATGVLFLLRERVRYAAWGSRGGSLGAMAIGSRGSSSAPTDIALLPL
jgi:hypothetical protein